MSIPHLLAEINLDQVRHAKFDVAVLPFGATEPHNLHLPYGTDSIEAQLIGGEACQRANAMGARTVLLPTIPYGTETNLAGFPLAMNLNPSTLLLVITDLVKSIVDSGIKKIVLLNSHGGNDLKPFLRELYGKTEAHLFLCNWYQMVKDEAAKIFEVADDHAGEMETSLILYCRPDLVAIDDDGKLTADSGATRPFAFEALQSGWISITRPWTKLTTNSGSGDPHAASVTKGAMLLDKICERVVPFLVELSNAKIDDLFPFKEFDK